MEKKNKEVSFSYQKTFLITFIFFNTEITPLGAISIGPEQSCSS